MCLATQWGVLMKPEWEPGPHQSYSESPRSDQHLHTTHRNTCPSFSLGLWFGIFSTSKFSIPS